MDLVSAPGNAIPSNPIVGTVTTPDGVLLRCARWRQTARKLLGTVLIVQGRSECIEKYFETITELRRRGFAVVTFDLRGQGGSQRLLDEPRKGHVDDFDEYVTDITAIIDQVMEPHSPKPWFGLSHSMGSAAMLLMLNAGETRLDRVVLLAPLTGLVAMPVPLAARTAAAALDFIALGTSFVPGGGATPLATRPFKGNKLSSDPIRYARISEIVTTAPELGLGDPTIRWTLAMFQAFDRFKERTFGRRLTVPTLMILPGSDPLCDSHASDELATRLRGCLSMIIPGAKHEILSERDGFRSQFWAAFDSFVPGEQQKGEQQKDEAAPQESAAA
jgi:lysophospholipase